MVCKRGIIWFFLFQLKIKNWVTVSSVTNGNKIYQHGASCSCALEPVHLFYFVCLMYSVLMLILVCWKVLLKFNWSVLLYVVYENHTCIDPICISSCKSLYFVLDPNHTQYAETIYVLIYVSSIHDFMYM